MKSFQHKVHALRAERKRTISRIEAALEKLGSDRDDPYADLETLRLVSDYVESLKTNTSDEIFERGGNLGSLAKIATALGVRATDAAQFYGPYRVNRRP